MGADESGLTVLGSTKNIFRNVFVRELDEIRVRPRLIPSLFKY